MIYLDTGCLVKLYYPEEDITQSLESTIGQIVEALKKRAEE